ncbi:SPOSA6832_03253, partial [Sporobolomyces salmonicolor]
MPGGTRGRERLAVGSLVGPLPTSSARAHAVRAPASLVSSFWRTDGGQKKVKKSADNINARLALVIKSGKYSLGYKSTLKAMRSGKSKLVLISGNTPPLRRSELEYYAMLSKTPVHLYQGSNVALGTAAGKLFRVGVMSIESAGDSDLLSVTSA